MRSGMWDVVIIGSGFGGSVCALRLAEAGLSTLVLERGARMTEGAWGELAIGDRPLAHRTWRSGLIQPGGVRGLLSISGNALGGTSQIYTAATVRPPAEIFDSGWPAGWGSERLRPYLDRVEAEISPRPIGCELSRTRLLDTAGRALGANVTRLPLAMDWPEDLRSVACPPAPEPSETRRQEFVTWLRGGRTQRKRTLDQTYLARAETSGAKILTLREATQIEPIEGGYRVGVRRWSGEKPDAEVFEARRVVIAAGTVNTVRLMLWCREALGTLPKLSEALGRRFSTNGDFGGLLVLRRDDLSLDCGPPVTAWVDLWRSDRMYLMDTGFLPVIQGWVGRATDLFRSPGALHQHVSTKLWTVGVMGLEKSESELKMDRNGDLWFLRGRGGEGFARRTTERLRELAAALGARLLLPPELLLGRRGVTVHPLGGASMADSPNRGVVDSSGEVFGYPGLFVADGSLLPTAVGVAPSMTIAALAEHVAASLLRRR